MALASTPAFGGASDPLRRASFGGFPSRPHARPSHLARARLASPYGPNAVAGVRTHGSDGGVLGRDYNLLASDPALAVARAVRSPGSCAMFDAISDGANTVVYSADAARDVPARAMSASPSRRLYAPDLVWSMDDDEFSSRKQFEEEEEEEEEEASLQESDGGDESEGDAFPRPTQFSPDHTRQAARLKVDESLVLLGIEEEEMRRALASEALARHQSFKRAAEERRLRAQAALSESMKALDERRKKLDARLAQEEAKRTQAVTAALHQRSREHEALQKESVSRMVGLLQLSEVEGVLAEATKLRHRVLAQRQTLANALKDAPDPVRLLLKKDVQAFNEALEPIKTCFQALLAAEETAKGVGATADDVERLRDCVDDVRKVSVGVDTAYKGFMESLARIEEAKKAAAKAEAAAAAASAASPGSPAHVPSPVKSPTGVGAVPGAATSPLAVPSLSPTKSPGAAAKGKAVAKKEVKERIPREYASPYAHAEYDERMAELASVHASLKTFTEDKSLGRMRIEVKKVIQTAINTISATPQQVTAKIKAIHDLLRQAPQGLPYKYALDIFAFKIVCQGDTQVHVHQHSAYPIAAVVAGVCTLHPEAAPLLIAHMHKKCPYTVPMYHPQREGQKPEEHLREIGYEESEGVLESEEKYTERMTGIVSLFAAIAQTPRQTVLTVDDAWTWLARVLNMPPRAITPSILLAFLELAGIRLQGRFGHQYRKMLQFLRTDFIPRIPTKNATAAIARLETYVDSALKGQAKRPEDNLDDIFMRVDPRRIT